MKADGTLTMSSGGMEFYGVWEYKDKQISISGPQIVGTASLSKDKNNLYFQNEIEGGELELFEGITFGSDSIEFIFHRIRN